MLKVEDVECLKWRNFKHTEILTKASNINTIAEKQEEYLQ